jgi:hypothetical protein
MMRVLGKAVPAGFSSSKLEERSRTKTGPNGAWCYLWQGDIFNDIMFTLFKKIGNKYKKDLL